MHAYIKRTEISKNRPTDSKHHSVQQTLGNRLGTQPQQLPVWLPITKLGVENGERPQQGIRKTR